MKAAVEPRVHPHAPPWWGRCLFIGGLVLIIPWVMGGMLFCVTYLFRYLNWVLKIFWEMAH